MNKRSFYKLGGFFVENYFLSKKKQLFGQKLALALHLNKKKYLCY